AAHQLARSPAPEPVGSILGGVLLAAVAIFLIDRNREFLIGEEADPRLRAAAIRALLAEPEVARVTYLRLEFVGPRLVSGIGHADLGETTRSRTSPSGSVRWKRRSMLPLPWPVPCSA